jgi:hypothetical protein
MESESMMFLRNRDWNYPLEKSDRRFDEHYDVTAEKFHMARGDVLTEWHFLEILWNRLQQDYRIYYESQSQTKEATRENFEHNVGIGRLLMHSLDCIRLDTNCFILNARILMDGIAYLTALLWQKIAKQQPSHRSFQEHKEWFKNNKDKIIDDDYAQYVLQRTDWFDTKLKSSRDKLIVHRYRSKDSYYVDAFKPDSGTVLKGKAEFKDKDGNVVVEYVMEQMPDLNKLMDSICSFFKFFDKHFSQIL